MSTIKVTPEQLLYVSKQIEQGRKQLESIRNDLTARIGFIESQWTGATQERFFYGFQQSCSVLNRTLESMVKSSQDLRAIAERFQQVDQEQVSLGAIAGQIAAGSIMNQDTANREEQQRMVYNPLFGVVMPASEAEDGMPGQKELNEYFNNGGSLEEMRAGPKQPESGGEDIYEEQISALTEGYNPFTGEAVPAWQAGVSIASLQLGKIAMAFTGKYNKSYKVPKEGLGFPKGMIGARYTVSNERVHHASVGDFNSKNRLINGGHGQENIKFLIKNKIPFNITKEYANGVRVGNIPNHKNKAKRSGEGQAWFPKEWTAEDIKKSGEYVANLPKNRNKGDGEWMFGTYNNVRVGVIKNDGQIGTITPDNSKQP
ncbi:WXG100 family type VII secretion target [Paenibacillus silvae]|jgi:WXG100 family type VII secretion target|uniref:WXG100 family type VII secretion target n=1 Tax=Paenibacillus silvae TaxID=1325358 RepID=UPI0025A1F31B|nr:WXG100 family type VII secretion target [Paenibacillus silvae]MDM5279670.1 WXG100 family type VII secretion target [Paenibacillus silvae]